MAENKRRVLYDDKEEHDFEWRDKQCLKEEEYREINGKKVPKLAVRSQHSSTSLRDNYDFAKEYKSRLDEEDCVFRDCSDTEKTPPKKRPKFKIKSVYVKIW